MNDSETATWVAARSGDARAFALIFDAHRDRVLGHALRLVRERSDAEDATAMVFLEAWRRRDAVRVVDGSIVAWLLVTTNNVVHNVERSRRRYRAMLARLPKPSSGDDVPDHAEAVDERLDQRARNEQVRAAFERLTQADQDVLTLCVLEGLSQAQAAQALGVPEGTVKSRLSRARRRLSDDTSEAFNRAAENIGGAR